MASTILFFSTGLALVLLICSRDSSGVDLSLGFHEEPSDVIAERNHPLTINCSAYSEVEYGPVAITWRHKGVAINEPRRKVLANGSLHFQRLVHQKKTGEGDAGEYQCVATNSVGSLTRTMHLAIANISRKFSKEPSTQTVEEGDVVRFSCQIAAIPPPIFTWHKDKESLPQNDDRLLTLNTSGTLLINGALMSDTGKYRCAATSLSSHRRSSEVHLEVNPASKQFRIPQILTPHYTTMVKSGEEAVLECAVSGYPRPEVQWNKNKLTDSSRILQKEPGLLIFTKVLPSDTGMYTCNATNQNAETREFHSVSQSFNLQVLVPPRFIKRPQSQVVPSVQTVRFECEVFGYPNPTIHWLKNGHPIPSNGRIKLKNHEMVILQTVTSDSGLYQCIAQNAAGSLSADARLKINASRDQPEPPKALWAKTLSSTSIELLWNASTPTNGLAIQAYTVHYSPAAGGDELQKVVVVNTNQVVDLLKPYTNYTFYVRAYNGRSASDQSKTIVWTTGEDVPTAAPSVTLVSSSPTTLHVFWDALRNEQARGIIEKYKIQWRRHNIDPPSIEEVGGDVSEYTITGLQPRMTYEVRVMGATKVGYPNLSEHSWHWVQHEMPDETADKVPSPPILDLTANSTTIKVRWKMPTTNKYEVVGYKLSYRKKDQKLRGPFIISNSNITHYLLTDLVSDAWYEVNVKAYNNNGDGRESTRRIQTLQESSLPVGKHDESQPTYIVVESPSHLEATPTSSTTINVSWKGPLTVRNISYFTVRYNPVHDNNMNASSVSYIKSTSKQVVITDLMPYTLYEFSVRSHNQDNVEGPYSNKVECKTQEDLPTAPTEVNWKVLNSQSVRVMWKPPQFPNGVITNYYILYNTEKQYPCHAEKWITKEEKGSQLSSIIEGLGSNTLYYFCLRAKTRAGMGKPTDLLSLSISSSLRLTNSTVQSLPSEEFQDPQLGIIVGVSIGVGCMIICAFIVVFRNRCFSSAVNAHRCDYYSNGHTVRCNGHQPNECISALDSREMESFMPMLTHITENANTHLDTKGGYPMPCCNGKRNGYSHSILRNAYVLGHPLKRNKQTMNITENPQTTWYLSTAQYHNNSLYDRSSPPSPLLGNREGMDVDDYEVASDESRNEDSGVQLAPSQETESFNQDSCSSRGSEIAERNSAAAAPVTYAIASPNEDRSALPRSRSWDAPLPHAEASPRPPS